VATLAGHSDSVYSVAFNPTNPLLATSSRDKTVKLWKLNIENFSIVPSISSDSAASQIRPSVSASANDSGLIISRNLNGTIIIKIKKKYLQPTRNSANKSCPNFMPLYKKIMAITPTEKKNETSKNLFIYSITMF
jgi:WD40 repeat protein